MNKVLLIGNLTKDVELKTTQSGKNVATCSMATNKTYTDQNGQKQTLVQYHNLVIWGKPAEVFARYLSKGKKVAIVGEMQTRDYTDKNNVKKYVTEVSVNEFEFLTPANQNGGGNQNYNQPAPANDYSQPDFGGAEDEIKVENIPF